MRSHVMNSDETHHHIKPNKKNVSSLIYGGSDAFTDTNHGLRENSKKACELADSSEHAMFLDKVCRECGKGFQSWKALFGHMKCHSEKLSTTTADDDDSWTSQSDDETLVPSPRKRSSRIKKYRATDAISTSLSASTSSEIEQEQEEVAMCLMMLSRDVGDWGGGCLDSVDESFDNHSGLLGSNIVIAKIDAKKISKVDEEFQMEEYLSKKNEFWEADELGYKRSNSSKRKRHYFFDQKVDMDYSTKLEYGALISQEKKSKFECGTCNKIFHSYQALGGHRASHKKQKTCSASTKINVGKNSNSTDQFSRCPNNRIEIDHEKADKTSSDLKKNKGSHECPICFRIFSSGQALGGHKRSHVIAVQKAEPIQEEMREFLDLNMPAPGEEESTDSHGGFKPWWISSNQKHEPLIGLLSS